MQVHLGIDVGKTNLRVRVFDSDLGLVDRWSNSTIDVIRAQNALEDRLLELKKQFEIQSLGISIFGPLQVDPEKEDYGALVESSEAVWSGVNIPKLVAGVVEQEVYFDFDVNAGALAEATMGAGIGKSSFVYLSVGTGIGAAYFRGSHRPGFAPQMGHMFIPREVDDLEFGSSCRFHGACLQGLASGKSLAQRWGIPAEKLGDEHRAWDLEARYLARACTNLIYTFSPEVIVLGSSVGVARSLIERINGHIPSMLNDFMDPDLRVLYREQSAVVGATCGADSSLIGAMILGAQRAGLQFDFTTDQNR
jgi:fructokinase